jgi:hypothetical protein
MLQSQRSIAAYDQTCISFSKDTNLEFTNKQNALCWELPQICNLALWLKCSRWNVIGETYRWRRNSRKIKGTLSILFSTTVAIPCNRKWWALPLRRVHYRETVNFSFPGWSANGSRLFIRGWPNNDSHRKMTFLRTSGTVQDVHLKVPTKSFSRPRWASQTYVGSVPKKSFSRYFVGSHIVWKIECLSPIKTPSPIVPIIA